MTKPDAISVRQAYDAWHASYGGDALDSPWHAWVVGALSSVAFANQVVLEIGCGRGSLAGWLADRPSPPHVQLAADFSETALRIARQVAPAPGVHWMAADLMRVPLADASVDWAISCETIEHVPQPARALQELARVLRPGGRLILTCPNYVNLTGVYRGYLRLRGRRYTEGGQPINHPLRRGRVLRWLLAAGFTVERAEGTGHYIPFPGRSPIRVHALDHAWPQQLWRMTALHGLIIARRR